MENFQRGEIFQEHSSGSNKNRTAVSVVILLVAVAVALYMFGINPFGRQTGEIEQNPPVVLNFPAGKMSALIPADLPITDGIQIVQNYEAEFPDGRSLEGAFQYISQEPEGDLIMAYSKY